MTRTLVIAAVLCALLAGAAAWLLRPGADEQGAMLVRDMRLAEARAQLEARLNQGDLGAAVVAPLSEIYLETGDTDAAIALLERALARAADPAVAERQARLFLETQALDRHVVLLERIEAAGGDVTVTRRLERIYSFLGRERDRQRALIVLARAGAATFDELAELAAMAAADGRPADGLAFLYSAGAAAPGAVDDTFAQSFAAMAIGAGRTDLVPALAPWLRGPDAPLTADLVIGLLDDGGATADATRFAQALAAANPGVAWAEALALERVLKAGSAEERAAAIARISQLGGAALPADTAARLIDSILRVGSIADAVRLATRFDVMRLPDWSLAALMRETARRGDATSQRALEAALAPLPERRLAAPRGLLAEALGNREAASRWLTIAEAESPNGLDTLQLVQALGGSAEARKRLDAAIRSGGIDFLAAAELARRLGDGGLALTAARRARTAADTPEARLAEAEALLMLGRTREALTVLDTLGGTPQADYAALDALVRLGRKREAAERAARLLARPGNGFDARTSLYGVLAAAGPPFPATVRAHAEMIAADLRRDPGGEALMARLRLLAALDPAAAAGPATDAARRHPEAAIPAADALTRTGSKPAAVRVLTDALSRTQDPSLQAAIVEALARLGAEAQALPALARLAETRGGSWAFAYADALRKAGRRDDLVAFLEAWSRRPGVSASERRDVAFALLDAGAREPAERTFRTLAAALPPDAPETQQLLFLWGPRPAPDALAWLAGRARAARGPEQITWLSLLTARGGAAEAATIGEALWRTAPGAGLAVVLADAFATTGNRAALRTVLAEGGRIAASDPAVLDQLVTRAETARFTDLAATLAVAAAQATPDDGGRAARAALLTWYGGDASASLPLFARAAARGGESARLRLAEGDALRSLGRLREASAAWNRALALAGANQDNRDVRALALVRTGAVREGTDLGLAVLAARDDTRFRAELGAALIDAGAIDDAERVLGRPAAASLTPR